MADSRFLVAGLGNPGPEYRLTRHNVGFLFLDHLAEVHGWRIDAARFHGLYCQGRLFGHQILYVKPQTYMNRSGECLRGFVDYFKVPLGHILVLHDDIDLASGRLKVVRGGGAGGHNGIRSITQHLGTQDFARLKIGVGRPVVSAEEARQTVERYVLSRIGEEEWQLLRQRMTLVEEAESIFLREGIAACMNGVNGR